MYQLILNQKLNFIIKQCFSRHCPYLKNLIPYWFLFIVFIRKPYFLTSYNVCQKRYCWNIFGWITILDCKESLNIMVWVAGGRVNILMTLRLFYIQITSHFAILYNSLYMLKIFFSRGIINNFLEGLKLFC